MWQSNLDKGTLCVIFRMMVQNVDINKRWINVELQEESFKSEFRIDSIICNVSDNLRVTQ